MNDNKRGKSSEGDGYAYRGRGRGGNQGSGSGTARGGKGNGGIGTGVGRMRVLPPNNIGNLTGQLPGLMAVETHGGGRGNGNQRGSGLPNRGNRGWRRHNSDHSKASSAPAPQVVENLNANQAEQSDDNDEPVPVPAMPKRHKKERNGPVFGFKRLYNFLKSEPNDILMSISQDKNDWKELLQAEDLAGDKLIVAIEVLGKVCVDVPVLLQLQADVLAACCNKPFANKLKDAIPKICSDTYVPPRRGRGAIQNDFPVDSSPKKVFEDLYQLCSFILKTMPHNAIDYFEAVIFALLAGSTVVDPSMGLLQTKFKPLHDQLVEKERAKQKLEAVRRQQQTFDDDDLAEFDDDAPPDDIKDIEVIPSVDELRRTAGTFLRPNKKSGSYKDSTHYLDVQFRLLREDFVQPLRKGIRTFLKERHEYITGKKRMPLGEVRLYTEVKIVKIEKVRDSVVYKLQLPQKTYKRIKWEKSKRLLVGSLILLTTVDNCFQAQTTFFGIVFSRNTNELGKGIVTVTWEGIPPTYDEDEEYLMVESEVYLEAYRHTLETLKILDLEKFPMKRFIVDASSEVDMPKYLKDATRLIELRLANGEPIHVPPQQAQWPTAEDFGLDENQYKAFHGAVTNEFTIIQGPPGTGKTFLGLKVAEVLLSNSYLWKGSIDDNPITVVCYTNHALDQFLEGILNYYKREKIEPDIIRIGGRSKSEALTKYALREVRQRKRRKLGGCYYAAERTAREDIYELEDRRASGMSEITGLQDVQGIVDFERLSSWQDIQPRYPKVLWTNFQNFSWLGISDDYLKAEQFYEDRVVQGWFEVRTFPKATGKAKKNQKELGQRNAATVERMRVINSEEEDSEDDEEDYDLEELMERRVIDDIILEAETSGRADMGRRITYLPAGSISGCEKSLKNLNHQLQEATRGMNGDQARQFRQTRQSDKTILENRGKLLGEIFRLYKEQMLDLPDVTTLLEEIQGGVAGALHYNRLRMSERWALYFAVVEYARQNIAEHVAIIEQDLGKAQKRLRNLIQYGDGLILKDCKVVGLTTTGAAKYNNLLQMMGSRIVIVEEAAEVFEAHIVTCITQNCQQLILIGDHQQLRPSPTVYNLAVKYNLDLSLFERMLNNRLHCYQLKMQHRMRPDISDLIIGPIYKELQNHDSVKLYPDIRGVTKNVYFVTHKQLESSEIDSMSKSNLHEAKFMAALCKHFILQGYDPDKITVLTMYMGQMFLLKKEIFKTCQGVRITCVDNFQGEENDIILLSLVRSNEQGKIGFLSIDNRICVSLSRAKHGLFVIGNMDAMIQSTTWGAIKHKLEAQDAIGDFLELECEIHRTRSLVQSSQDFSTAAPEGGCSLMCDTTLPCSHKCAMVCHVIDREHKKYVCRQPCVNQCANLLHPCRGKCFEKCPPCLVQVERVLNCELKHKRMMFCHKKVEEITCYERVDKTLPCGHVETLACHIRSLDYKCKVKVDKQLPCGHTKTGVECNVDPNTINCKTHLPKTLLCGHEQLDECWKSTENIKCMTMVPKMFTKCGHETKVECHRQHEPTICKGKCTIRLKCGHACTKYCHIDEDPDHLMYQCKKNCSKECVSGHVCKGQHQCYKGCPPCKDDILRSLPCGHEKVLPCHVQTESYECLENCERFLQNCGHKCPKLCFQPCGPCTTKIKKIAPCRHTQLVLCGDLPTKANCIELVPPSNTPVCRHRDTRVPCKFDQASPEELAKFCSSPCGHTFSPAVGKGCDHKCSGTCSSCLQGRIHMKCQAECGRQLVCGHVCEVPCSAICPPCQKPCLMKCEHSECKKKCGQPCSECKEKCSWRCPHKQCNKLCGEMCDREPCDEPCPKKLDCGHDCVGFCGEPCPNLCRECDKDELTEVFFGYEDEEDANFVYLPDCKHTIEARGLEMWLTSSGGKQITSKRCPKCKVPIRNCRRFMNLIRQHHRDIITVKMRSFGNRANSDKMRNGCITIVNNSVEMSRIFPRLQVRIQNLLFSEVPRNKGGISLVPKTIDEFSMRSLEFIVDLVAHAAKDILQHKGRGNLKQPHDGEVTSVYRQTFNWMLDRQPLSRQEVIDFNEEMDRVDYYKQLVMRRSLEHCNYDNTRAWPTYQKAEAIVTSTMPFTPAKKQTFKILLKELDDLLRSGLGISERERREITSALGMGQGHWFKCPNGHIYVIGDCGGAVVEGRCNECGSQIGGGGHRLRADNQVATEMDGARMSAWDNTVQNYQQRFA